MCLEVRPFLLQGVNIAPLLRPWSTMTIIKLYPSIEVSRLVIKSIPINLNNQCDSEGIGYSNGLVGLIDILVSHKVLESRPKI